MKKSINILIVRIFVNLLLIVYVADVSAADRILVWSDEFEGSTIDRSVWDFDIGPTNDNIHYYTDRPENAAIKDGALQIIAHKETYMGYDYTSALLSTKNSVSWRYGRFEARIKLPGSHGFVPAFWMLPADDRYGWWPNSGEIDIMEHPTNEVDKIYGTVHTRAYNLFNGSFPPQGDILQIPDAESAFHIYSVEWTPAEIDFYVDDQKYFSFTNDGNGTATWPFDQPFYLIANLAVGGGWVGEPDAGSQFPVIMEVDYVRVYQYPEDITINGPDFCTPEGSNVNYFVPLLDGETYSWSVPNRAHIISGQNSAEIEVDWDIFSGDIELGLGSLVKELPVEVSSNLIKNEGFEKGVKYWKKSAAYPAEAGFILSDTEARSGSYSVFADVLSPGANAWDVQLVQTGIRLEKGKTYSVSLSGMKATGSGEISVSIINSTDFTLYGQANFSITDSWAEYAFNFVAPADASASFNLDLGSHTGSYYFDDLQLLPPQPEPINQVLNASFKEESTHWSLTVLAPAEASGGVLDGEFNVNISNGGINLWDINLAQAGIEILDGEQYIVSFDAYASAPRTISALTGQNEEPWTVYSGENSFNLSDRRQTCQYSFFMNNTSDPNARLVFDLGSNNEDVVIDNVFLGMEDLSAYVERPRGLDAKIHDSFQIFPNPIHSQATIEFNLTEGNVVKIHVLTIDGQHVETLLNQYLNAGEHTMSWNVDEKNLPGIYFIRLTTNQYEVTRKVFLIP
jgi:beta-glucanase (GH16 family)